MRPAGAGVAELADAGDSKSPGLNARAGSTPAPGTSFLFALAQLQYQRKEIYPPVAHGGLFLQAGIFNAGIVKNLTARLSACRTFSETRSFQAPKIFRQVGYPRFSSRNRAANTTAHNSVIIAGIVKTQV